MRLSNIKRIVVEDFPQEYRELVDKIAYVINPMLDQLVTGLNKNINLENLSREITTFTVIVDADGTPTIPTQMKTNLQSRILGMNVINAQNTTSSNTYPDTAPFVSWTVNGNIITVKNITGLQAGERYSLSVEIIS